MPFFGSDWRAPGDKWIRTDVGWKRLTDIHATFQRQLGKVAASVMASKRNGSARMRSHIGSPRTTSSTCNSSRASSRASSPIRERMGEKKVCSEQRLQIIRASLAQRCVSVRNSSRESNHYATASDAISKLNFHQALYDSNCYPFICQLVQILFEEHYWSLSGSMQTSLLRLSETAKDIAIESRHHTGSVLRLIEKQLTTLEKGRSKMMTGFSVSRLDSRIKTLLGYRAQLVGELQRNAPRDGVCDGGNGGDNRAHLPDDCWRHVIGFLVHPRDVLNLGLVNSSLYCLTSEGTVWKSLAQYHYSKDLSAVVQSESSVCEAITMDTFRQLYKLNGKRLRNVESHALVLCQVCDCVYWRDYGHPCTVSLLPHQTSATSNGNTNLNEDCMKRVPTGLTAHQFVQLYQC